MKFIIICTTLLGSFLTAAAAPAAVTITDQVTAAATTAVPAAVNISDQIKSLEGQYNNALDGVRLLPENYADHAASAAENIASYLDSAMIKPGVTADNRNFLRVAAASKIVFDLVNLINTEIHTLSERETFGTISRAVYQQEVKPLNARIGWLNQLIDALYELYPVIQP